VCGRVALFTPPARLARFLDAALAAGLDPDGHPHWNIGPRQQLLAAARHEEDRVLDHYWWGLIPGWAKDPSVANRLFNARAETVAEKPSFRSAFARRPCVVPVDGFYEWDHRTPGVAQPHYFHRADGNPLLLAGLWEHWRDPAGVATDPPVATCTVITTTPSDDVDGLHDRMPVVLELDDVTPWLDVAHHEPAERLRLLDPSPAGTLVHYPVRRDVGSLRHDGPQLIEPTTLL
jgi:putative SOS response-associated peptidase YedK